MRATSASGRALLRRHWCTAQCSLSTGTSSAPGVARNGCTTGPAAIRLSLFASARRLPAASVARVTGSPANPTTALTTTSAALHHIGHLADDLTPGSAAATSARLAGSATATSCRPELAGLRDDRVGRRTDPEPDDLVGLGLGADHLERLRPDRPRRPGDRHPDRLIDQSASQPRQQRSTTPQRRAGQRARERWCRARG